MHKHNRDWQVRYKEGGECITEFHDLEYAAHLDKSNFGGRVGREGSAEVFKKESEEK